MLKPCSDERQNGFRGLKVKRCEFLEPFFTLCEHDCFCLKTLKHFRFKCLRGFLRCPEKCPREKRPPEISPPRKLPPEKCPPGKLPPGKLFP